MTMKFRGTCPATARDFPWGRALLGVMAGLLACLPGLARAEKSEIAIAKQFSIAFLPLIIMEQDRLIEKHARAAGMPDVKVNWLTFSGPDVMISSLLSGSADVAAAGIPGALNVWARTRGTRQEVKGIAAIGAVPLYLVTRDPAIASVKDLKDTDRIATPGGKGTINAVLLQLNAAETLGDASIARFDPLLISLGQPEATAAMLSGVETVKNVVSTSPFQDQLLAAPGMRKLFSSFAVMGGGGCDRYHSGALHEADLVKELDEWYLVLDGGRILPSQDHADLAFLLGGPQVGRREHRTRDVGILGERHLPARDPLHRRAEPLPDRAGEVGAGQPAGPHELELLAPPRCEDEPVEHEEVAMEAGIGQDTLACDCATMLREDEARSTWPGRT